MNKKKNLAKYEILNHMLNYGDTSKVELSKILNLSMPTVLSNVNELIEKGIIEEKGEMESTGGRKARQIGICSEYAYSIGVNITAGHLTLVLINMGAEIVKEKRIYLKFEPNVSYCSQLADYINEFFKGVVEKEKILGVGIALPGIINNDKKMVAKSHALNLENYSLKIIEQIIPFPIHFENDANSAMLAENPNIFENAVYLSLNNTLGGAISLNGELFTGQSKKAGEFGHMLLIPGGKQCYCGKSGCADAYCAASVLTDNGNLTLDDFMQKIDDDENLQQIWDDYLENLAILISNVRLVFDMDIILGGSVGRYLPAHMMKLGEKVMKYNLFDGDLSYLKNCNYKREAAAVGVAKQFFKQFIEQL